MNEHKTHVPTNAAAASTQRHTRKQCYPPFFYCSESEIVHRHVPWPQQQPEYGCPSSAFGLARLHLRTAPPRLTKAPSSWRRGMIASEPLRANLPPRALRSSSVMCGASPVSCAGRIPRLASWLLRELPIRGFTQEHGVKLRWIDTLT